MALSSSSRHSGPFVATQGQRDFNIDWPVLGQAIAITLDGLSLANDGFSVVENGNGATVSLNNGVNAGVKVRIYGTAVRARNITWAPETGFRSETLNREFDVLQAQLQEVGRDIDRAVKLPLGDPLPALGPVLPNSYLAANASKLLYWAQLLNGVSASALGVLIGQAANAAVVRDLVAAAEFKQLERVWNRHSKPPSDVQARKASHTTAFLGPLGAIPTAMGGGEPPMLVAAADNTKAGLNEAFIRGHVQLLARMGIRRIVISHVEFGGYHWLMPPIGQSWPDRLGAAGKPIWYWDQVGGDKTYYLNIDLVDILFQEAAIQGLSVVQGASRFDDYNLLNDDYTTRIGYRPQSTLTIPSGVTGSHPASANIPTYTLADVGKIIKPETGAGLGVITAFGDATNITVNISEAFGAGSYVAGAWRKLSPDPMSFGMTVTARMTRAVEATQAVVAWGFARWGHLSSYAGVYSAFEPDAIENMGEYFGRVWNVSGVNPALSTYRTVNGKKLEWWASTASPIDLFDTNVDRLRAAIKASGISHLSEQDGIGAGTNRLSGVYDWVAGQAVTLGQLWAANLAYRKILSGTYVVYLMHNELWEMAGPAYTKAYPAAFARLLAQWANSQDISHEGAIYQTLGIFSLPTDSCRLPVATTFKADYRALGEALTAGFLAQYESLNAAVAYPYAIVNEDFDIKAWSSFGGAFTTDVLTYTPAERASAALIKADIHIGRSGAAGSGTGYCEVSIVVGGTELTATRVKIMQDDDRDGTAALSAIIPLKGGATTISIRVDNQLYAPTAPLVTSVINVKERVG